jgi:hypothetical protein
MQEKFKKALYADANAIGIAILSLGIKENERHRGFFIFGLTALDVVKRIVERHDPLRMTHFAAKEYMKGYQSLLDNTDLKACVHNSEAQKRFDRVEAALSARLLDDLLSSYARSARAETERLRRERMRVHNRNRYVRAVKKAASISRLPPPNVGQATA